MGILKEFKKFAMQGNVMDMAIGVIVGAAFGKIVSSLVTDIIMPPIGMLTGGVDFSNLVIVLKNASDLAPAITINYGLFLNTVIDFLIVSFAIFLMVRQINRIRKKEEPKKDSEPEISEEVLLLREIRDYLKGRPSREG